MSGICSRHQDHDPNCPLCCADIRDVIPDYDEKAVEAAATGSHTCECGFEFFKVVSFCPRCSRNLPGVCLVHEKFDHACLGCRRGGVG